jgi:hypothetical protein
MFSDFDAQAAIGGDAAKAAGSLSLTTYACELNGHAVIVMVEDHCSSVRPACGRSRRRNDHGYEQEGWIVTTQQEPEDASEVGVTVRLPVCHEEGSWSFQAGAAQGAGRLPVRD